MSSEVNKRGKKSGIKTFKLILTNSSVCVIILTVESDVCKSHLQMFAERSENYDYKSSKRMSASYRRKKET